MMPPLIGGLQKTTFRHAFPGRKGIFGTITWKRQTTSYAELNV